MKKLLLFLIVFVISSFSFAPGVLADQKDATCPPGYIQPIVCYGSGWCCKSTGIGGLACEGSKGIPLTCDAARAMWTSEAPLNFCAQSGKYYFVYDAATKKCISGPPTATYLCLTANCATAIGSVPTGDLSQFLQFALKWSFYASGGIILLMVIATGYTVLTSAGNPDKLQAAQENIIALLSGLGLIVFSLVLLKAIGAGILGLPGF